MLLPRDYNMVFWSYEPKDAVTLLKNISAFMGRFGTDYMPQYLAGDKIALDTKSIERTLDSWKEDSGLLATGLTSKNDIVLRMTVGVPITQSLRKPEVLSIGFNCEHLVGGAPILTFEQLQLVFEFCLELFEPFYAYCGKSDEVSFNARYKEAFYTVDSDKVPVTIQWFNYFNPEMVERLGGFDKVLSSPGYHAGLITSLGGILLVLQRDPFDYRDPEDLERRLLAEAYLDLDSLHRKYPR